MRLRRRFAYVDQNELANNTLSGGVSMYSNDATTGKLTSIGSVDATADVLSLAVHPSGNFAYATADSFLSPHVSVYTLNAATGVLASNGTAADGMESSVDRAPTWTHGAALTRASADVCCAATQTLPLVHCQTGQSGALSHRR
jgi:6-phosphogluconolactonase (cycloisomerase 2 family)